MNEARVHAYICNLKLESLHMKLNYGLKLIKKISYMTQINLSSKWMAGMKVERIERRVSRGYASDGLGGQGNQSSQRLKILESWRARC